MDRATLHAPPPRPAQSTHTPSSLRNLSSRNTRAFHSCLRLRCTHAQTNHVLKSSSELGNSCDQLDRGCSHFRRARESPSDRCDDVMSLCYSCTYVSESEPETSEFALIRRRFNLRSCGESESGRSGGERGGARGGVRSHFRPT